jgi:hypothetical protein
MNVELSALVQHVHPRPASATDQAAIGRPRARPAADAGLLHTLPFFVSFVFFVVEQLFSGEVPCPM